MTLLDVAQAMRGKLRDGYSAPQAGGAAMTSEMAYGTARADSVGGFVEIVMDNMPAGADPDDYAFTVACDAPITKDDRVALVTINGTSKAVSTATVAQIAQDAANIASATNQYFWHDTNGIHVSTDEADPAGTRNILINSLGILLRKAAQTLVSISETAIAFFDGNGDQTASFGASGAIIGKTSEANVVVSASDVAVFGDGAELVKLGAQNYASGAFTGGGKITFAGDSYPSEIIGERGTVYVNAGAGALGLGAVRLQGKNAGAVAGKSQSNTLIVGGNYGDLGERALEVTSRNKTASSYETVTAMALTSRGNLTVAGDFTNGDGDALATVAKGGTVLYTYGTGTGANNTFPLLSSAANFDLLDFVFTDGTRYYTERLYAPDGKAFSLSRSVVSGSSIYHNAMMGSVSGTTVTLGAEAQIYASGNAASTTSSSSLKVVEVKGR